MACALLPACTDAGTGGEEAVRHVLLVYMAGDTGDGLSGDSYDKLEAMRLGWQGGGDRRLLVYQDATGASPRLMEVADRCITVLGEYPEENSASAATLRRVISEAKSSCPDAEFNLLVYSHGSGWSPPKETKIAGRLEDAGKVKSILYDDGYKSRMGLSDFAASIPDKSFSSLVFEACNMACIEVAYALRDKAQLIVASSAEIVSPGFCSAYGTCVDELAVGNAQRFAQEAFAFFDGQDGAMRSSTLSVIKTEKLEELAAFVKSHCDYVKDIDLQGLQRFGREQTGAYDLYFDFEDYYGSLLGTEEEKQQLGTLLGSIVVWKEATPWFLQGLSQSEGPFRIGKHSGLTTYIPQEKHPEWNSGYEHLRWCADSRP